MEARDSARLHHTTSPERCTHHTHVQAEVGAPDAGHPNWGRISFSSEFSPLASPAFRGRGGDDLARELTAMLRRSFFPDPKSNRAWFGWGRGERGARRRTLGAETFVCGGSSASCVRPAEACEDHATAPACAWQSGRCRPRSPCAEAHGPGARLTWTPAGGGLDLTTLCIVPGKCCWVLNLDVLVLAMGGSVPDAASIAVKVGG